MQWTWLKLLYSNSKIIWTITRGGSIAPVYYRHEWNSLCVARGTIHVCACAVYMTVDCSLQQKHTRSGVILTYQYNMHVTTSLDNIFKGSLLSLVAIFTSFVIMQLAFDFQHICNVCLPKPFDGRNYLFPSTCKMKKSAGYATFINLWLVLDSVGWFVIPFQKLVPSKGNFIAK